MMRILSVFFQRRALLLLISILVAAIVSPSPVLSEVQREVAATKSIVPDEAIVTSKPGAPIQIIATTTLLGDLTRNLVGDTAQVTTLMGPGVDPHLYAVTAGDMRKLTNAPIVIYHGLHLEGRMSEVLAKLKTRTTVIAAGELAPRERLRLAEGAVADPHIWFDVGLWREVAMRLSHWLADEFNRRSLDGSAVLQRGSQYADKLLALDAEVRAAMAAIPAPKRILITAHDAFGYFGAQYQVSVRGIQGVSTDSEAGLARVNELIDTFVDFKIPAIFAETSVSDRAVKAIADGTKAKGHKIKVAGPLYTDALGMPGSGAEDYIGMVRANVRMIAEALNPLHN